MRVVWADTMRGAGGSVPDIAILLKQTWGMQQNEPLDAEGICRIWAFDLGWFDMETAQRIRDNLIQTGWLDAEGDQLRPSIDTRDVEIPFGWLPTMRTLEAPPIAPRMTHIPEKVEVDEERGEEESVVVEETPIDPAVSHITTLLEQIADASGLNRKEVMRRAQRKRRALGPVTLWMALLLVAREQQLPMHAYVRMISA